MLERLILFLLANKDDAEHLLSKKKGRQLHHTTTFSPRFNGQNGGIICPILPIVRSYQNGGCSD